jgi:hypothetical protein
MGARKRQTTHHTKHLLHMLQQTRPGAHLLMPAQQSFLVGQITAAA